jgi:hypothetical protein
MVVNYPKPKTEETAALKPALASIPNAIAYYGGVSRSKFYADILPLLKTVNFGARRFVVVSSMDQLIAERASVQSAGLKSHEGASVEGAEAVGQQNEPGACRSHNINTYRADTRACARSAVIPRNG